jgi:hypothetical protein
MGYVLHSNVLKITRPYSPHFITLNRILMSLLEVACQSISPGGIIALLFLAALIVISFVRLTLVMPGTFQAYGRFIYSSFLKPHTGDSNGKQQGALESLYHS